MTFLAVNFSVLKYFTHKSTPFKDYFKGVGLALSSCGQYTRVTQINPPRQKNEQRILLLQFSAEWYIPAMSSEIFFQVLCLFYLCFFVNAAAKANVPLSLRYCSMLKEVSVFGIQRPSVASVRRRCCRINLECSAKY